MILDISEVGWPRSFEKHVSSNIWNYKPRSSSAGPVSSSFLHPSIVLFNPAIGVNSKPDISTSFVARIYTVEKINTEEICPRIVHTIIHLLLTVFWIRCPWENWVQVILVRPSPSASGWRINGKEREWKDKGNFDLFNLLFNKPMPKIVVSSFVNGLLFYLWKSSRVATHQELKNSLTFHWLQDNFHWIVKETENHWSELLFLQTSLESIIFHDAFLKENIISWLSQTSKIFPDLLRNSPTLKNFCFSLTVATCLVSKACQARVVTKVEWAQSTSVTMKFAYCQPHAVK